MEDLDEIESKASLINKEIAEEFSRLGEQELERFFDEFECDKRTQNFIICYNKTVLDRERINFSEFKGQWAIQGMTKEFYKSFDENFDKLKEEIQKEKDIRTFFKNYCCTIRREASFCSKLFHTILPSEFPPVDRYVRMRFNLQNEKDFIKSVLILKRGYELFITENQGILSLIRKILSKDKFSYLRVKELSDMRILDMYYWFKGNRMKKAESMPKETKKKKIVGLAITGKENMEKIRKNADWLCKKHNIEIYFESKK